MKKWKKDHHLSKKKKGWKNETTNTPEKTHYYYDYDLSILSLILNDPSVSLMQRPWDFSRSPGLF